MQHLKTETGAATPPTPASPHCSHPCKSSLLAPHVSQTEVGGWSLGDLAPDQFCSHNLAPWRYMGSRMGTPHVSSVN